MIYDDEGGGHQASNHRIEESIGRFSIRDTKNRSIRGSFLSDRGSSRWITRANPRVKMIRERNTLLFHRGGRDVRRVIFLIIKKVVRWRLGVREDWRGLIHYIRLNDIKKQGELITDILELKINLSFQISNTLIHKCYRVDRRSEGVSGVGASNFRVRTWGSSTLTGGIRAGLCLGSRDGRRHGRGRLKGASNQIDGDSAIDEASGESKVSEVSED